MDWRIRRSGSTTLPTGRCTCRPPTTPTMARNSRSVPARSFLGNYQDNTSNNRIQAMRMIGMAEARTVVNDPTLAAQLDNAIAFANTLLRRRQRADGGAGGK